MYILLIGYLFFDEFASFIFTMFNIEISTDNEISLYVYVKVLFGIIVILYTIISIIIKKRVNWFFVFTLFISFAITLFLIITSLYYSRQPLSRSTLITISYLVPFILLCGYTIPNLDLKKITMFIPYIIVTLFLTGTIGIAIPNISGEMKNALSGFTYQNTSYFFSMGFLLILVKILIRQRESGILTISILDTFLIIYFLILSFFGGGKGSIITILVSLLLFTLLSKINFKYIVYSVTTILLFIGIIYSLRERIALLDNGILRALSFISLDSEVLWENSSGRDSIYQLALQLIYAKPILGWGLGSSYFTPLGGYPHNIFLEALLDGGICLFLVLASLLFSSFIYLFKNAKLKVEFIFIFMGFTFNFVLLQFSGSYLFGTYFLWFGMLIFLYNKIFNKYKEL